ncbi:YcaO-like family protein [Shigella flexneri]
MSEVFERYGKSASLLKASACRKSPADVLARYPAVVEAIEMLASGRLPIFAYDGSLGGQYPVICVVLFNPPGPDLPSLIPARILILALHWNVP